MKLNTKSYNNKTTTIKSPAYKCTTKVTTTVAATTFKITLLISAEKFHSWINK